MIQDGWRAVLLSGLALITIFLALAESIQPSKADANLLVNGDFERGFTYRDGCGHVGTGWGCFTNGGQAVYGFYDDQWAPVVADGAHSQLIEINTKGLGAGTDDRYAGIFQTVRLTPNTTYQIAARGMIRTTTPADEKLDPWRYRVQFGWTIGRRADWRAVDNWVDVGWDAYDNRLAPSNFGDFRAKFIAQEPYVTVYLRVWKKWGTVGEEIDINLDSISLVTATRDSTVLPIFTLTPTVIVSPLQLPQGTLVTALPTPQPAAPDSPLPPDPAEIRDWPRISGNHVAFSYPSAWLPTANELGSNTIFDEYRLGIPNVGGEQLLGFYNTPFGSLQPDSVLSVSRITIGGKLGAKWVRQGPTFVGYQYCSEGLDPQSTFCVRVALPLGNPMIELQLDYLVQSITFY
ncbi:MAG: hypothetical protein KF832_16920 [Caldilineaceae bacterium]|nr:hypothetical protein [Caldilineaceae bacterium]